MKEVLTFVKDDRELKKVAEQFAKVFPGKSYYDFFQVRENYTSKAPYFKPEYERIIKVNDEIVSHISIVEKRFRIGGAVIKMGGIGDVYTLPPYRKKNFTSMLMNDSIEYMRQNKFPLSLLFGIPNFYHRFGYIESVLRCFITIPLKNIGDLKSQNKIRPVDATDIPVLNKLYNRGFNRRTLSVKRVNKSWFNIPTLNCVYVVTDKKNSITGYVITNTDPTLKRTESFDILEAVTFDKISAEAIVVFLKDCARSMYQNELRLRQRPDTYFAEYLCDFGGVKKIEIPYEGRGGGMLRIILLKELFEDLREELSSRLLSHSDFPKNAQIHFKTDIGEITLASCDEGIDLTNRINKSAITIETPQTALTRLIVGYWSAERFLRRVKAESVSDKCLLLLQMLFPQDIPCISDCDFF